MPSMVHNNITQPINKCIIAWSILAPLCMDGRHTWAAVALVRHNCVCTQYMHPYNTVLIVLPVTGRNPTNTDWDLDWGKQHSTLHKLWSLEEGVGGESTDLIVLSDDPLTTWWPLYWRHAMPSRWPWSVRTNSLVDVLQTCRDGGSEFLCIDLHVVWQNGFYHFLKFEVSIAIKLLAQRKRNDIIICFDYVMTMHHTL